jgi:cytochrome c
MSKFRNVARGLIAIGVIAVVGAAHAEQRGPDVSMGPAIVQGLCGGCHSFDASIVLEMVPQSEQAVGPHLQGVYGRPAGSVASYAYSKALKKLDVVWTEDTLRAFLSDPLTYAPGTKKLIAVKNQDRLDEVIAYLKSAQSAPAR